MPRLKPPPRTLEAVPLRERIRNYLCLTGSGSAHYKEMAKDMGCDERRVANTCHDMLKRGHLAHMWVNRTEYKPGVYCLPLEIVHTS